MATVRELVVALGLDFDSSGFAKAEAAIKVLKTGFLGVGAVIGAAKAVLTGVTVAMAKQADEINDFAVSIGVSTDAVQKLGYAAQLSGSNSETLKQGLVFLARNAEAASSGSKEAAENFGKFGVSLHDSNGQLKTSDRLLLDIANGAQNMKNPTERAALAASLLGKNAGPHLVQFLSQGEEGIAKLGDELEDLGGLMDRDFIESAADLNDTLDRMNVVIKSVGLIIAKAFLPTVKKMTDGMVAWWRANRQLVDTRLTFFVQRMASAFEGINVVIKSILSVFSRFDGETSVMKRSLFTLAAAAVLLAAAFFLPAAPIIILSGLILALLDDINEFKNGNESLIGDVIKEWDNFRFHLTELKNEADGIVAVFLKIGEVAAKVGNLVAKMFGSKKGFAGATDELIEALGLDRADAALSTGFDPIRRFVTGDTDVGSRLAGGSPGSAPVSSSSQTMQSVNIQSPVTVNVTTAPGEAEQAGASVRKHMEEIRQEELRAARAALVPAGAP